MHHVYSCLVGFVRSIIRNDSCWIEIICKDRILEWAVVAQTQKGSEYYSQSLIVVVSDSLLLYLNSATVNYSIVRICQLQWIE